MLLAERGQLRYHPARHAAMRSTPNSPEPEAMQSSSLAAHLAARIGALIREEGTSPGTHLAERKLAEHLKVSRSPVRGAFRLLAAEGVIGEAEGGGYVVLDPARAFAPPSEATPADDEVYLRIADERLNGALPDRVTENALLRRYGITRVRLGQILGRIRSEGWIERLPGNGWEFLPVLTSLKSYEDSYRYRLAIEPAAILEPGFTLDRNALAARRAEQQALVDGGIRSISNAALFDTNSRFHETIIACSGNAFFTEGLRRVDLLRRLMEYRQSLDRKRAAVRCREHVHLADLLLADERGEAARFMAWHLSTVGSEKVAPLPGSVTVAD